MFNPIHIQINLSSYLRNFRTYYNYFTDFINQIFQMGSVEVCIIDCFYFIFRQIFFTFQFDNAHVSLLFF